MEAGAGLLCETTREGRSRCVVIFIVKIIVHLYGQTGCLVAEILLERGKVSLTGMEIFPYNINTYERASLFARMKFLI